MEKRTAITTTSGGQQLFGILHLPDQAATPPPLVVIMHGFGSHKVGTNRSYVTLAEHFSKAGMASLRFDFRGSGDSEGTFGTLSFEDLVEDAVAMLNFAKQHSEVDGERVALFGASLGGTLAVLAAKAVKDLSALVLWAPVASGELWVRDFIAQNPELMKQDPHTLLSTYKGMPINPEFREQFARMSAAKEMGHLDSIPVLHMHGENDQTVSLLHQQVYKMHCEQRNSPARFISFPETEHCLGTAPVFPQVAQETVDWLSEHLVGAAYAR